MAFYARPKHACGAEMILGTVGWLCPVCIDSKVRPVTASDRHGIRMAHPDWCADPPRPEDLVEGECPECDGTGDVECDICNGAGEDSCPECGHAIDCDECDGTGWLDCQNCDGSGKVLVEKVGGCDG